MKKIMLVTMLVTLVGCASTSDLDKLHTQVDSDMKAMAESDAKSLATMNTKLDNVFKHIMAK